MKRRVIRKGLQLACYLATGLYAGQGLTDWSDKQPYGGYNPGYGDFPPADIDQRLSGQADTDNSSPQSNSQSQSQASSPVAIPQQATSGQIQNPATPRAAPPAVPNVATQNYPAQQPAYGAYPYYNQAQPGMQPYNTAPGRRGSGFSGPWNNNGSSFSGPWNNRGSSLSSPWNNNGSNFSGPWNNQGSNFSGPWNNNGSSFSGPWNNNRSGSGFSPWGNGGGWSW